jgi:hypothetical protein
MKKFLIFMFVFPMSVLAQNNEFSNFNQALLQNLGDDLNEISSFVKKEEQKKQKRTPSSLNNPKKDAKLLQVSVHDVSRYQTHKSQFIKNRQATYEIDQIRNFDYKNYYVNGGNNF